jgi:hypothetical protein
LSKEKRRRAVAALIRRGGAMIPVYASEKKTEELARERRGFFTELHRVEQVRVRREA